MTPVRCTCGVCWDWLDVPSLGLQDDGAGGLLDLRNCPSCGTTLAREVQSSSLAPYERTTQRGAPCNTTFH
ncbi:MAG: hypothetical protein KF718_31805 [Polyangiaceae bacterium]|nr:hypothetical protein [Polyangiaceae bacterium]